MKRLDIVEIKKKLSLLGPKIIEKVVNKDMLFSLISALIFLAVFQYGYRQIPPKYYEYRDDGIITLSHAKNLADYGTIGINPSGERVEGYSAPCQFIAYYILYEITGISFKTYSHLQTLLATFLLGFIFIKFFKANYPVGLVLSFVSAVLLIKNPSFLGWHGSGMENAVVHVLFLAAVYLLYKMYTESRINHYYAIFVFFAAIARIESVYYILPVLFLFSISWYIKHKNFSGLHFLLIVMGIWVTFNAARYIYFGDLMPNTAYGQRIDIATTIKKLLAFSPKYYQHLASLSAKIMDMHFGYLIVLTFPLLYFVKRQKEFLFLVTLLACMIATSYLNPYFFGISRIEPTRTTTHLAVAAVLLASFVVSKLCIKKHTYWILPLFIITTLFLSGLNAVKPYYLGWDIDYFSTIRKEFLKLKRIHDISRPTVSNVDLGVISWHKDFNIVDLGTLGNPVVARIRHLKDKRLMTHYFFDMAAPDFIELHDNPAKAYHYIFEDPRFRELYEPIREKRSPWLKENAKKYPKVMKGIWIRKDIKKASTSRERLFLDRLQENLSIDIIKEELARCSNQNHPNTCTYAARTVYRFIPELVSKGIYEKVVALFRENNASGFDMALLGGRKNSNWYNEMIAFLKQYQP